MRSFPREPKFSNEYSFKILVASFLRIVFGILWYVRILLGDSREAAGGTGKTAGKLSDFSDEVRPVY